MIKLILETTDRLLLHLQPVYFCTYELQNGKTAKYSIKYDGPLNDVPEYLLTEMKPEYLKGNAIKPSKQSNKLVIKPVELKPKLIFQYTDEYLIELLNKLPDKYLDNNSE